MSFAVQRLTRFDFAELQQSRAYDWLMRLPMLGWAILLAMASVGDLVRYVGTADPALPFAIYAIKIAMRLSTIAFLVLLMTTVVLRERPTGKARGVEPRVSALLGTCLISAVVFFPRRELSFAGEIVVDPADPDRQRAGGPGAQPPRPFLQRDGGGAAACDRGRLSDRPSPALPRRDDGGLRGPAAVPVPLDRVAFRGAARRPAAANAQRGGRPRRSLSGIRGL